VAILDEESLLATCAYIDLNPVAAGLVEVPEASPHTSITERVEHVKSQGRTSDLKAAEHGSVAVRQAHDAAVRKAHDGAGSGVSAGLEETIWLCPIEDRRRLDSAREGMLEGVSLGSYLLLVDYTGRLFRDGKTVISAELSGILDRLGSSRARPSALAKHEIRNSKSEMGTQNPRSTPRRSAAAKHEIRNSKSENGNAKREIRNSELQIPGPGNRLENLAR